MNTNRHVLFAAALLLTAGANTARPEKTLHVRGWIGGEFKLAKSARIIQHRETVSAFPASLPTDQKSGIFVERVYAGTPAAQAGLEVGDLILSIDDRSVRSLSTFHDTIRGTKPGDSLQVTLWRRGEILDRTVVVGRETFRNVGTLGLGIHLSSQLDLWPNPSFSLGVLGFQRKGKGTELRSPEHEFVRQTNLSNNPKETKPQEPNRSEDVGSNSDSDCDADAESYRSDGWRVWVLPIQVGRHVKVISQEPAAPSARVKHPSLTGEAPSLAETAVDALSLDGAGDRRVAAFLGNCGLGRAEAPLRTTVIDPAYWADNAPL